MSPRAACQLEAFGFERVHDYTLGIADWRAAGLPTEGTETRSFLTVADAARTDVPTAQRTEVVGEVKTRIEDSGWVEAIVIDPSRIVVGRIRGTAFAHDPSTPVGDIMELGPTTVRPDTALEPLAERMQSKDTKLVTVTTPQGELIGALRAEDIHQSTPPDYEWCECEGCPGQRKPRP